MSLYVLQNPIADNIQLFWCSKNVEHYFVIDVLVCRSQVYHSNIHTIEAVVRECKRGSTVASEGSTITGAVFTEGNVEEMSTTSVDERWSWEFAEEGRLGHGVAIAAEGDASNRDSHPFVPPSITTL